MGLTAPPEKPNALFEWSGSKWKLIGASARNSIDISASKRSSYALQRGAHHPMLSMAADGDWVYGVAEGELWRRRHDGARWSSVRKMDEAIRPIGLDRGTLYGARGGLPRFRQRAAIDDARYPG